MGKRARTRCGLKPRLRGELPDAPSAVGQFANVDLELGLGTVELLLLRAKTTWAQVLAQLPHRSWE
jgi:hypothetical protein